MNITKISTALATVALTATLSAAPASASSDSCSGRPSGTYCVTTFGSAPGYLYPASGTDKMFQGYLYAGNNYVYCRAWGPEKRVGSDYNHYWLWTTLDSTGNNGWVSAYYLSNWGNDQAKDNSGREIKDC
ncbi:hypothetical protein ACIBG8_35445 [Nonomuraea sp. NPDC050556]|uniref:hypothetical protein n=1 Tax=Nonomuraea sp. NPDC050556 TaxID=3364369 RepID=UPI0037A024C3